MPPGTLALPGPPPVAPRRPHRLEAHGDVRVDDWYWLRDRDDPEVIAYLQAENDYADGALAPLAERRERLYQQIRSRVQEDDVSAPARHGPWWYWTRTREGEQYGAHFRLPDPDHRLGPLAALDAASSGDGQLVLDENQLAAGHDYFALGVLDGSPDHRLLAYATDHNGSERYTLRVRDLDGGVELEDTIADVTYTSAWAADNATLFYVRPDEAMRPFQVWRHRLGGEVKDDELVYHEADERFYVSVGLTRSERYILVHSASKLTSEVRWIDARRPDAEPAVILPRAHGVEYDVDHAALPGRGDGWVVRTNADAPTFSLRWMPVGDAAGGETLVGAQPDVTVTGADAFRGHVVVSERAGGVERLRVLTLAPPGSAGPVADDHLVDQPEPVYSVSGAMNAEFDTTTLRFGYTSLVTPPSTVEYEMVSRQRQVVKVQPVLGGYAAGDYRTEREWATAPDGTRVPISLVCRRDQPLDGSAPCLLYGYGAYEITIDPAFSSARLNLLERGFVFAIAHVRGGGELGRRWYEDGRLERKPNTFSDFVACAEHLVAGGWTSPERLVIRGGSAGGLLMGAVTNQRPDLFRAVVAEVPFVDVVTTMSDETLPLTVTEWEEWGNPITDAAAYRTMKSYSPYDNVAARDYPWMYVTAGLNDPRVGFWEPAKWVAKLRATRTDDHPLLLRTEMGAGHAGPSGRYEVWKDEARAQAFILTAAGIDG